jgi:uncharacterized protein YbjT (DUF2867 family)
MSRSAGLSHHQRNGRKYDRQGSRDIMRVAVAGGTGLIGRVVVEQLRGRGDDAVVISRSAGVDLTTGAGLASALAGVDAVIDVSNVLTMKAAESIAFFETATKTLLAAEQAAGVRHHVVLSIVGIDRVELGYYAGKVRQEELALAGPVPASVLRATQFHDFAAQILQRGSGPFAVVPKFRSQPVALDEVAAALLSLAASPPAGLVPDLAGPEVLELPDMARQLLRRRHSRRVVIPVRLPGAAGRAASSGGLLPLEPGPRGTGTFAEWLATQ